MVKTKKSYNNVELVTKLAEEKTELIPAMRCIGCDNPIVIKNRIVKTDHIYTHCLTCKRKIRHVVSFLSPEEVEEYYRGKALARKL